MKAAAIQSIYRFLPYVFNRRLDQSSARGVGISTLLCHEHVVKFIYAMYSLQYFLRESLPIYIVDDGSLDNTDKAMLKTLLSANIESPASAEKKMKERLSDYPYFLAYRLDPYNAVTRKKWDAFLIAPFPKILYVDPDVLFFREPVAIRRWINDSNPAPFAVQHARYSVGADKRQDIDYSFRLLIHKTKFPLLSPSFNSGLVGIPSVSIYPLKKLDMIFKYFSVLSYQRAFTAEETALSIALCGSKLTFLPSGDYVCVARYSEYKTFRGRVGNRYITFIHYIDETDTLLTRDAVRLAVKTKFFYGHPC